MKKANCLILLFIERKNLPKAMLLRPLSPFLIKMTTQHARLLLMITTNGLLRRFNTHWRVKQSLVLLSKAS